MQRENPEAEKDIIDEWIGFLIMSTYHSRNGNFRTFCIIGHDDGLYLLRLTIMMLMLVLCLDTIQQEQGNY
jgi:hypothetical protein